MALSSAPISLLAAEASTTWTAQDVATYWTGYFMSTYASMSIDYDSAGWATQIAWNEEFRYWQTKLGRGDAIPLMRWRHDLCEQAAVAQLQNWFHYVDVDHFHERIHDMAVNGGYWVRTANLETSLANDLTIQFPEGKVPLYYGAHNGLNRLDCGRIVLDLANDKLIDTAIPVCDRALADLGLSSVAFSDKRGQMAKIGQPAAPQHPLGYEKGGGGGTYFTDGPFMEPSWEPGAFDRSVERFLNGLLELRSHTYICIGETNASGHPVGEGITDPDLVNVIVPVGSYHDPSELDALIP